MVRTAIVLAASLVVVASARPARADDPRPDGAVTVVRTARGTLAYQAHGVVVIHGEPQRPQQFNVTGRSPLGYTATATAPRFVQRVLDATRASPF